jgi:PspA-Associated protein
MIVRLMGERQYRVDHALLDQLNGLDDEASAAIDANDPAALAQHLTAIWATVRAEGTPLADDDLSPSDALVPPFDLSLEEARRLLGDEGFIPDLPVQRTAADAGATEKNARQRRFESSHGRG